MKSNYPKREDFHVRISMSLLSFASWMRFSTIRRLSFQLVFRHVPEGFFATNRRFQGFPEKMSRNNQEIRVPAKREVTWGNGLEITRFQAIE